MKYLQLLVLMLLTCSLLGQSIEVSGLVTSFEDGEPIIGGAVVLKDDPNIGTTTDIDGKFSFTVPSEESVLVFSYVGLATQEMTVGSNRTFNVVMVLDESMINEIVVIGYGAEKRSGINAAVSVVTAEEITTTPVVRIEQALQGRVAGVTVSQNSGSPGGTLSVRIRGAGSLGNNDPLYVVDGIPVGGLDYLNSADIESVSILKDAAATAIYGSRGANGVVLITTKNGKNAKKGQISYDGYYGVQSPWKKMNLLNAREYAIIQNEAFIAAGNIPRPEFQNPDVLGEGTDWQDAIFEDSPITSHTVRLSGSGENSHYSISGGYFEQDGIIGGDKASFKRYTARLTSEHKIKEWLTVGASLGFTNLKRTALVENNEFSTPLIRALNMDPTTPVRKADGTFAYSRYIDTDIANPVNQIAQTYDEWTTNRVVGSVYGQFYLTPEISLRSTYSVDATFATQDIFFPAYDLSNDPDLGDAPAQEISLNNAVILNHNTWKNAQFENVLTYSKTFNRRHQLTVDVGNTLLSNRYEYSGGANSNLPSNDPDDAYISNTTDPIESQSAFEGAEEDALLSYFARVNYNIDEKYFVTGIMRADGSSKFLGTDNEFGYFPAVSLGWLASNEDWNLGAISYLKFRLGWGRIGNNNVPNYRTLSVVSSGQNYAFGPNETITNGSAPLVIENSELKWETVEQYNVGFDIELLNGKVSATTDYFIKNTLDMLFAPQIPLTGGAAGPTANIATMQNRGWELALSYKDRVGKFSYDFGGNITFINNEVTNLGTEGELLPGGAVTFHGGSTTLTQVGEELGGFYGYVTDGIFQDGEEVAAHATQNGAEPGDIRYKDLNDDGEITEADRAYIGSPYADFTYGFTIGAKYADFDLGIFMQGSQGNDIYNASVRYDLPFSNRPSSILDRWTGPGTSDSEPRVSLNDPNNNSRASDRFIEDGSYMRVKNIQLGYTLPRKLADRAKIDKLRVYASANNLFTFTKYSGFDPEIGAYAGVLSAGIDRGFYPQAKSFLFGLQLTF